MGLFGFFRKKTRGADPLRPQELRDVEAEAAQPTSGPTAEGGS